MKDKGNWQSAELTVTTDDGETKRVSDLSNVSMSIEDSRLREAFVAGFMATGEGYNGEYAGSTTNNPRKEAIEDFEIWNCKRQGGHNWSAWECDDAQYGDRLRCTRSCTECPKGDYEFRDKDE